MDSSDVPEYGSILQMNRTEFGKIKIWEYNGTLTLVENVDSRQND